jgi:hypothetical protein
MLASGLLLCDYSAWMQRTPRVATFPERHGRVSAQMRIRQSGIAAPRRSQSKFAALLTLVVNCAMSSPLGGSMQLALSEENLIL